MANDVIWAVKKILGFGETVEVTMEDFTVDSGHFHLSGSGASGFTCASHKFNKDGQTIKTDLSDCLPNNVIVEGIQYCSDQDTLEVKVNDKNIPFGLGRLTVEAKKCGVWRAVASHQQQLFWQWFP